MANQWFTNEFFNGETTLFIGLLLVVIGLGTAHLVKGTLAGLGRFNSYARYVIGEGIGRLLLVIAVVIFTTKNVGRGTAVADFDNDGDLDLLVNAVADPPRLLRNDGGNQQHWLIVELRGAEHRDALGTIVKVRFGTTTLTRERQSGGSYLSSHDPRLHFGLGAATNVDLEIRWPDGQTQQLIAVASDQILHLSQPLSP